MTTAKPCAGPGLATSITARTLPEAVLHMFLLGCEPVDHKVQQQPGSSRHRFVCAHGQADGIKTFDYLVPPPSEDAGLLGGPEPSRLITAQQFLDTAKRLSGSVPSRPIPLVPAAVKGCLSDLQLALACVQEAFRFIPEGADRIPSQPAEPPGASRVELFEQAKALRGRYERWQGVLEQLADAPPLRDLPAPKLTLEQLRAVRDAAGMPAQDLLCGAVGPWAFAGRFPGPPEQALFRHVDGLAMWVEIQGDKVAKVHVLEGMRALEVHAKHSFRLTARHRLRLREALLPGRPATQALNQALESQGRAARLIEARSEGQMVRFHRIDTTGVHRTACLVTVQDEQGILLGYRLLEALTALQQLEVLAEAAPMLPASTGAAPENRAKHLVLAQVAVVATAAQQLIQAMSDPSFDTRSLAPRSDDFEKVFRAPILVLAHRHFEQLWRTQTPRPRPAPALGQLRVSVCPANAFGAIPELSAGFPDGYNTLAPSLVAGRTWVAWHHSRSERATGPADDGLVWIDDHWAWFPGLGGSDLQGRWT